MLGKIFGGNPTARPILKALKAHLDTILLLSQMGGWIADHASGENNYGNVYEWLEIPMPAQTAVTLVQLRTQIDALLEQLVRSTDRINIAKAMGYRRHRDVMLNSIVSWNS